MTYPQLAYDDTETRSMHLDCDEALTALRRTPRPGVAERALRPAPSIAYEDNSTERPKPEIHVSDAAARLAAALELHLD